ncbi:hypothetical protein R3P38DRAFT_3199314 [Favolaschia claudopus]|uniref:Uncharacterized protein n=1 Tax=Favolaschia claudopus TaxID=2862362 RepID=A0AAW0B3F8_9AGAR
MSCFGRITLRVIFPDLSPPILLWLDDTIPLPTTMIPYYWNLFQDAGLLNRFTPHDSGGMRYSSFLSMFPISRLRVEGVAPIEPGCGVTPYSGAPHFISLDLHFLANHQPDRVTGQDFRLLCLAFCATAYLAASHALSFNLRSFLDSQLDGATFVTMVRSPNGTACNCILFNSYVLDYFRTRCSAARCCIGPHLSGPFMPPFFANSEFDGFTDETAIYTIELITSSDFRASFLSLLHAFSHTVVLWPSALQLRSLDPAMLPVLTHSSERHVDIIRS